jgi:hypothetical protein
VSQLNRSKFAGILGAAPAPEQIESAGRNETLPPPVTPRPVGRPPGKRSDPSWKQYSVLLRRDTQRKASNILRDREEGDFSALMQHLLEEWVASQAS